MSPQGGSFLKWSKTTSADWLLAHLTFLFYRGGGTDKRYNVHFGSTKMLTILAFLVFHANGNELFTQISSAAETRQCGMRFSHACNRFKLWQTDPRSCPAHRIRPKKSRGDLSNSFLHSIDRQRCPPIF